MNSRHLFFALLAAFLWLAALPSPSNAEPAPLIYEMDGEFQPFRMIEDGVAYGFEVELSRVIFRGSQYFPVYRMSDATGNNGYTDANLFGWREINNITRQQYTLSNPVFYFRWGPYTLENAPSRLTYGAMQKYRIGVVKGRFPHYHLLSKGVETIHVFEDSPSAARALLDKKIDVLFDEAISIFHTLVGQHASARTHYHAELEIMTPVAIAAPKGDKGIINFIDRRLAEIKKSGEYEDIYNRHFRGKSAFYESESRKRTYKTASALVVIFSVAGILAVFVFYRQLLRVAREKAFADTLIEKASSFILIWNENLDIVRTNARVENFLGYRKEELAEMKVTDIISVPDTIANNSLTSRMTSRNGNGIEVLWDINKFSRSHDRNRYIMAAGSDITEITSLRQSLEASLEKLRESERRFELATSGGNVGIISCDMKKNDVYISPVGYKLLGYDKQPESVSNSQWLSWIHPADINIFQLNVLSVETQANANPSPEVRILRQDGSYKWFLFSFKAKFNEEGQISVLSGAFLDIDERKKMEILTQKLAFEDPVSGTQNRHFLMTEGEKILIRANKSSLGVCLVIFDIDGFKLINMRGGMTSGDQLLQEVGERAKKFLGSAGLLARLSGDEFACLIPMKATEGVSEKLSAAIGALGDVLRGIDASKYGVKKITFCAGSSVFPIDSTELSGLIENASVSLLAAKSQGAGSVKIYDNNLKNSARRDEVLRRDILNVIKNDQLMVYYQPKIDLTTEAICGAEALARWAHPDFGVIHPDYFINVAEDLGVILAVDYYMLREACRQNAAWQRLGFPPIRLSVNMSAEGFLSDKAYEYAQSILEETGLDPHWLEIEITESQAMRDIARAMDSMRRLESLGITLSLDDFGTGYSSLHYMKKLPIKMIKLDRSFILDIDSNPTSQMIVNTVVQLSKKLDMKVTAEGVENNFQEMHLKNIGCELAQGYLYSKPVPADEFEVMLRTGKTDKQKKDPR